MCAADKALLFEFEVVVRRSPPSRVGSWRRMYLTRPALDLTLVFETPKRTGFTGFPSRGTLGEIVDEAHEVMLGELDGEE